MLTNPTELLRFPIPWLDFQYSVDDNVIPGLFTGMTIIISKVDLLYSLIRIRSLIDPNTNFNDIVFLQVTKMKEN